MKKFLILAVVFFNISVYAQSDVKITSKKCLPKKGFHLRLKNVLNDSRCPENVTCVWAGEVSVVTEVFKDKQFVEEKTLTFNTKNNGENNLWFSKYYKKKIETIAVLPYPKQGVVIRPKKQFIEVRFAD